jgi:uncharacterized protein YecT (DUF1311 family)
MIEFNDAYELMQRLRHLNKQTAHRVKEGQSVWTAEHVEDCKRITRLTEELIDVLWRYFKP